MRRLLLVVSVMWAVVSASGQEAFFECFEAMYSQRTEFGRLTAPIDAHLDSCFAGGYYYLLDFDKSYSDEKGTTARGIAIGDFGEDATKAILLTMKDSNMTYQTKALAWNFGENFKKVYDIILNSYMPYFPNGNYIYESEDYRDMAAHVLCIVNESRMRLYNIHLGGYHLFTKGSPFRNLFIMSEVVRPRLENGTIGRGWLD